MTPEFIVQKKSILYQNPLITQIFKDLSIKNVTLDIMRVITKEANPEGIIAEISSPRFLDESDPIESGDCVLILFKISNPGNLGTLIRTARAFNWNRIVLVGDCVDPFNFECIRSSMGSVLKVKIHLFSEEKLSKFLKDNKINAYIAANINGFLTDKNINTASSRDSMGIILGSESHGFLGFPEDVYKALPKIKIEMNNDIESLNVAISGSILMNIFSNIK